MEKREKLKQLDRRPWISRAGDRHEGFRTERSIPLKWSWNHERRENVSKIHVTQFTSIKNVIAAVIMYIN